MRVHALDQWGRSVEVEIPDTTTTATVDLAPMRRAVESMERTAERIATLRKEWQRIEDEYQRLDIERHRARAKLAEAEGDEDRRVYCSTYADAQSGVPGKREEFMRLCRIRDAQRVIEGRESLDDYGARERPAVAAEVERLRAEQTN